MKELRNKNLRISILKILKRIGMFFLAINLMGPVEVLSPSSKSAIKKQIADLKMERNSFNQSLDSYLRTIKNKGIGRYISLGNLGNQFESYLDIVEKSDKEKLYTLDLFISMKKNEGTDKRSILQLQRELNNIRENINKKVDEKIKSLENKNNKELLVEETLSRFDGNEKKEKKFRRGNIFPLKRCQRFFNSFQR